MLEAERTLRMVAFDIWADFGHFRKGYTTTSPLTYSFPSRTAISGLVAAIIGLKRDSYYNLFQENNSAVAIQILNPIKRININQNLIDTKKGYFLWDIKDQSKSRTQIRYEYLKDPKYRIFIWLKDDEKFKSLYDMVSNRKNVFSLYMGISEHIAQFMPYNGGYVIAEYRETNGEIVKIHSIIPSDKAKISIDQNDKNYVYSIERVPGFMDEKRVVKKYIDLYYEENGKPLKIISGKYYNIGGDINILPF